MRIDEKLLAQALANNNSRFMETVSLGIEEHSFTNSFERKMKHLIDANKKYGGRIWLEKTIRYSTQIAAVILCFIAVNFVSVKAFNLNLWNMIVDATSQFVNITFDKQSEEKVCASEKLQIVNIPEGYTLLNATDGMANNQQGELYVQIFTSDEGTITYTETLISESINIDVESGESFEEKAGDRTVTCIEQDSSITVIFTDDVYCHIVEIQGKDANVQFALNIIEEMEER